MNKHLLLVVEDDSAIRNLITTTLETHNYRFQTASSGEAAVLEVSSYNPEVILLDLGLPDIDGVEVIKKIRSRTKIPIIVISARGEDSDKIEALDAGADDYLTKPFSVEELLARLRVTFRRLNDAGSNDPARNQSFINGDLKIDYDAGCVYMGEQELHLTPMEYKLICLLAQNMGKVMTHAAITRVIWGSAWENDVASLRVFMAALRKKIEPDASNPIYIQTHVGVGYRMMKV